MISLSYLLAYLLTGRVAWHASLKQDDPDYIYKIRKLKQILTPREICTSKASCLIPFVEETFRTQYEEESDYDKLKHYLLKALLDTDKIPCDEFDWSKLKTNRGRAKPWELQPMVDDPVV